MPLKTVTFFQEEITLEIMNQKSFFLSVYFNILLKVEEDLQVQKYHVPKAFMSGLMKTLRIHENSGWGTAKYVLF